jgi:hypothetical protein
VALFDAPLPSHESHDTVYSLRVHTRRTLSFGSPGWVFFASLFPSTPSRFPSGWNLALLWFYSVYIYNIYLFGPIHANAGERLLIIVTRGYRAHFPRRTTQVFCSFDHTRAARLKPFGTTTHELSLPGVLTPYHRARRVSGST